MSPIGFTTQKTEVPAPQQTTDMVKITGHKKLTALLQIASKIDAEMQKMAKQHFNATKPFITQKGAKLETYLNKIYIRYYEPL